MRFGLRIFATMVVAFSLLPALLAAPMPQASGEDDTTPKVELFVGYSYLRNAPESAGNRLVFLHGGSTSVAFNVNRYLGLVADFGGFHATRFGPNAPPTGGVVSASGDVVTYMFGPRLSFRHKVTPFVQALFGGGYAGPVTLSGCSGFGCTPLPSENAFAMTAGGGLDLTVRRHVALRLFQAEYLMTRFKDRSTLAGNSARQNDVRLSTGLVFRFGGAEPALPPAASCSVQPAEVLAGEPVTALASASNFNPKRTVSYKWSGTGVNVSGDSANTQIDTTGLAPGTYQVTANLSDGHRNNAMCNASFTVRRPSALAMSCSANPSSVQPGGSSAITSEVSNAGNHALTYSYTATAGQISGNGASTTLYTAGVQPSTITVTCNASDSRPNPLTASATTMVTVEAAPAPVTPAPAQASRLNQIDFKRNRSRVDNAAKAILDDVALRLQREPDSKVVLVGEADASETHNKQLATQRALNARDYLIREKGIDANRIETRAGNDGGQQTQIWLVPAGATY